MTKITKEFSIIVWGATGFTGGLVADYLAESAPIEISFAIAGRSATKLEGVYNRLIRLNPKLKGSVGKIIADSNDEKSLDSMVKRAEVIISTVGPYIKFGLPLVDACVRNGTDYVDITGEAQFIKQCILNYHEKALEKGISIVHSCGFDSIPSDLGVFLLSDYFKSKGLQLNNARLQVLNARGGASGGTIHSLIAMMEGSSFKELSELGSNPNFLIPGMKQGNAWGPTFLYYDKALKSYQTFFIMEAANTKIVRRSNALLGYNAQDFQYCEGFKAANIISAIAFSFGMSILSLCLLFPPFRWILGKIMPPGSGPNEKTRKNGFFDIKIVGEAKTVCFCD